VSATVLAASCEGDGFCAPTVDEFFPPSIFEFTLLGIEFEITRITVISWIATAAIILFFVMAAKGAKIVPGKLQFAGESIYQGVRGSAARDVIGSHDEGRFAHYLVALFAFILANNIMAIVPFANISPSAKISMNVVLAMISWALFIYAGSKKHGVGTFFKNSLFPPGVPKPVYIILTPIEFVSTFIARPFTLAVRLFANLFAGHMLLAVFALGAAYLFTVGNFSVIFSPVSALAAIGMTFFEVLVAGLQAYVFTMLTSVYISSALAEEH
jgi:F-type H+-transporting ATPase subunit a